MARARKESVYTRTILFTGSHSLQLFSLMRRQCMFTCLNRHALCFLAAMEFGGLASALSCDSSMLLFWHVSRLHIANRRRTHHGSLCATCAGCAGQLLHCNILDPLSLIWPAFDNWILTGCLYHAEEKCLFFSWSWRQCPSIDGHPGRFPFLAIMTRVAMNIAEQMCLQ